MKDQMLAVQLDIYIKVLVKWSMIKSWESDEKIIFTNVLKRLKQQ